MSTFSSKFNKVTFNIDTTDYKYTKLSDIFYSSEMGGKDVIHQIDGMFINNSQFGESPIFICNKYQYLINLPKHLTNTVKEILQDIEGVEAIKDGKVGFTIYEYESHGRKCHSINFIDL